jgi:hypothetical protein
MHPTPRTLALVLLAAPFALASPGAHAQECVFPPIASPGAAEPPPPVFSGVFVASPPPSSVDVPLNVQVRLGGQVAELDTNPPNFTFELLDDQGARVPVLRTGVLVRAAAPLRPNAVYTARVAPTETNPCVSCFVAHEISFETSVAEDHEPPVMTRAPDTIGFAFPSQAELQRCGIFTQETHSIVIDLDASLPRDASIAIAARHERSDPAFVSEVSPAGASFSLVTSAGQVPVRAGDAVYVAFTARDLAGNTADAVIVRTRLRPVADSLLPREQLADLTCDVPAALAVRAADPLPKNGLVQVAFPFEEQPISLRAQDDTLVALVPVTDTLNGHVYAPGSPLIAGSYQLVTRDCPNCVCVGCRYTETSTVTVSDREDHDAPAAPKVLAFSEDLDPSPSSDVCAPDGPALVITLERGADDLTDALALRYRARVKIEDGLTYELGDGHAPVPGDDDTVTLRVETPGLPRLLGERLTLTLDVSDAAGNSARTEKVFDPDRDAAGGCSSVRTDRARPTFALFALLPLCAVLRRAERRSRSAASPSASGRARRAPRRG